MEETKDNKIDPKEFTKSAILHKDKEFIQKAMKRFFAYRNYYKKEVKPAKTAEEIAKEVGLI